MIAKLKGQGYPEIEPKGDRYWVMAGDADGKKISYHFTKTLKGAFEDIVDRVKEKASECSLR